jgi:hypothetical protein
MTLIATPSYSPYADESVNLIYNMLFCDNIDLYKKNSHGTFTYPWDILFSDGVNYNDLNKIIADPQVESRTKVLAYNRLLSDGHFENKKEILGVVVEVGLDEGLDVLAVFKDGSARYINYTGKIIIWDTKDDFFFSLKNKLFFQSEKIVKEIGPWDENRQPNPENGQVRISFLVSEGLYLGQGPVNALFNDPKAGPILKTASEIMGLMIDTASKS